MPLLKNLSIYCIYNLAKQDTSRVLLKPETYHMFPSRPHYFKILKHHPTSHSLWNEEKSRVHWICIYGKPENWDIMVLFLVCRRSSIFEGYRSYLIIWHYILTNREIIHIQRILIEGSSRHLPVALVQSETHRRKIQIGIIL